MKVKNTSHSSGEVLKILTTHIYRSLHCNKALFRAVLSDQAACSFNYSGEGRENKFVIGDLI